jgi:glycerol uptake facilitator-like aquaporin
MTLARRLLAEALGTGLLTAAVVGSGVMAEQLADGNGAVALLANTAATVAALALSIALFGPISGAHFNPAVTLALALLRRHTWRETWAYVGTQIAAAISGTILAHAMFALPPIDPSTHARTGLALWLSEIVATFGLLLVVLGHRRTEDVPWMVAAWIGAAYWFTASTSFANPAIAIARSLTDTFSGIRPSDVPAFVVAEAAGALAALVLYRVLFAPSTAAAASR